MMHDRKRRPVSGFSPFHPFGCACDVLGRDLWAESLLLPVIPADRPGVRTTKPVKHNGNDGQIAR
jgi:hypothetical protein